MNYVKLYLSLTSCIALRNALNKLFPQNKKLLCTCHMLNKLSDYCNKKTFKDDDVVVEEFNRVFLL